MFFFFFFIFVGVLIIILEVAVGVSVFCGGEGGIPEVSPGVEVKVAYILLNLDHLLV